MRSRTLLLGDFYKEAHSKSGLHIGRSIWRPVTSYPVLGHSTRLQSKEELLLGPLANSKSSKHWLGCLRCWTERLRLRKTIICLCGAALLAVKLFQPLTPELDPVPLKWPTSTASRLFWIVGRHEFRVENNRRPKYGALIKSRCALEHGRLFN